MFYIPPAHSILPIPVPIPHMSFHASLALFFAI